MVKAWPSETILVEGTMQFGGGVLEGDVVLPLVKGFKFRAKSKKPKAWNGMEVDITCFLPSDLCLNVDDVAWLEHNLTARVVFEFPKDLLPKK